MTSTTTAPHSKRDSSNGGGAAAQRRPRSDQAVAWPEARRRAGSVPPLPARRVPLPQACGRVLAEDIAALADLPATDNAAMDGWAVAGPPPWRGPRARRC